MSREILFKAKLKNWRELPEENWWVEGYYAKFGIGDNIKHFIVQNCAILKLFVREEDNMVFNDVEIDPETLCQYTGVNDGIKWEQLSDTERGKFLTEWNTEKDRQNRKEDWSGRRIWENDIVTCNRREKEAKYKVVWDKTYADWRIEKINGLGIMPICIEEGNMPVFGRHYNRIGNIFDNPDLLKED